LFDAEAVADSSSEDDSEGDSSASVDVDSTFEAYKTLKNNSNELQTTNYEKRHSIRILQLRQTMSFQSAFDTLQGHLQRLQHMVQGKLIVYRSQQANDAMHDLNKKATTSLNVSDLADSYTLMVTRLSDERVEIEASLQPENTYALATLKADIVDLENCVHRALVKAQANDIESVNIQASGSVAVGQSAPGQLRLKDVLEKVEQLKIDLYDENRWKDVLQPESKVVHSLRLATKAAEQGEEIILLREEALVLVTDTDEGHSRHESLTEQHARLSTDFNSYYFNYSENAALLLQFKTALSTCHLRIETQRCIDDTEWVETLKHKSFASVQRYEEGLKLVKHIQLQLKTSKELHAKLTRVLKYATVEDGEVLAQRLDEGKLALKVLGERLVPFERVVYENYGKEPWIYENVTAKAAAPGKVVTASQRRPRD
jgi:hypothetical protein